MDVFVDSRVQVLGSDGSVIVGTLKGFDANTNLILTSAEQRY